jgi:hypothetical protein
VAVIELFHRSDLKVVATEEDQTGNAIPLPTKISTLRKASSVRFLWNDVPDCFLNLLPLWYLL